jgi:hypothetical protein
MDWHWRLGMDVCIYLRTGICMSQIRVKWLDFITPFQVWLIVRFKRYSWASARASQIIRKSEARKFGYVITGIRDRWQDWMHPEQGRASLLIALTIIFLPQIILISGIYQYLRPVISPLGEPNALQSALIVAWQVLASLIGIAFVIIVFLTQYAVDRKFERRALPLFASRTWMVFSVVMGLLTLLSMGGNVLLFDLVADPTNPQGIIVPEFLQSIALYNLILFAGNILLTIRLYIITYELLSPEHFKDEFSRYLQRLVKEGVHTELRNRIAQRLVVDQCNREGIDFSIFDNYPNRTSVIVPGLSKTISEITDVNLDLLHVVARRVRRTSVSQDGKAIIFLGELGRRLSTERPQIAYVSLGHEHRYITYPLEMAVRLTPLARRRRRSDLGNDLVLNRDMMASAIRNGSSDEVEYLLDNYLETLRSFLQAFEAVGMRYSFEMAQKELSLFSEWPFVSSILKQYVHLLDLALKSDDSEIVYLFTGFPLQVMALAFQEKDHLLFRRFSNLYTAIYVRATRYLENQELKRYVKDRSWRLLVDFDQYQIAHAIENSVISNQDIGAITDYSIQILLVLNRLLKSSIDQQDWQQYGLFAAAMRHIYKEVDGKFDQYLLEILDMRMEQFRGQSVPEAFQQEYRRSHEIVRQKNRVDNTRRVLMMGIGAWLIHLFEAGSFTSTDFFDYLSSIAPDFLSVESMYELYCAHVPTGKMHDLTDWTSWELEEKPETPGEPTFSPLAFDSWIARYYVIRMLELMPTNENMALPDLKPFVNSKGTLETVKNQLTYLENSAAWQDYLNVNTPTYRDRASALIQIHQEAADEQEILEEIELVNQPLDPERIKAFFEDVEKSWLESATLRSLFVYHNKYAERPAAEPPDGLLAFGLHKLDDKGAYVNQNRIGYPDWGGAYGRSLGQSEDKFLSVEISNLESATVPENNLDGAIQQTLAEMKASEYRPIILCERSVLFKKLYKSPHFQTRWRAQTSLLDQLGAQGLYEDSLVFGLGGLQDKRIVLLDFRSYATLVQYRPTEKNDFPLYLYVEEISTERAREILDKNPDWAKHPQTKEALSEEEALRRIQKHVIIQIWERFQLENIDTKAGRVLQVIDALNGVQSREAT